MKALLKLLGQAAPTIARALGAPALAVGALERLSKAVLGKPDGSHEEIAAELAKANPEVYAKLHEADLEFEKFVAENNLQLERLATEDRASARAREIAVRDWVPAALAIAVLAIFALVQWWVLTHAVPADSKEIISRALGTLDAAVVMVLSYYFGTSSGSNRKTELMGQALNGKSS